MSISRPAFAKQMFGADGQQMKVHKSLQDAISFTSAQMKEQHNAVTGKIRDGIAKERTRVTEELRKRHRNLNQTGSFSVSPGRG